MANNKPPVPPHRRLGPDQEAWEGDDVRWTTRLRRRYFQKSSVSSNSSSLPVRNNLIRINVLVYLYQAMSSINWIRKRYPSFWPRQALPIVGDAIVGRTAMKHSPLVLDFVYQPQWSLRQPHRFITSGFLHGGILHLLLNMDALRRLPMWLETGLGGPLYLTTFLVSIVTGNLSYTWMSSSSSSLPSISLCCLGASGGICGLYGLLYVNLMRMGNTKASKEVLLGMGRLLLYGMFFDERVSNAGHVGGFFGGLLVALLCAPSSYGKSYALRRKWSLDADPYPRDYRQAMGFGTKPAPSSFISLSVFWMITAVLVATMATAASILDVELGVHLELQLKSLIQMPLMILRGLIKPGSVYAAL